jgi:hypothetical protein
MGVVMTALRANRTGRSTQKPARSREQKIKGPPKGEPFVCLTLQLIESDAVRTLSNAETKILFRLIAEHMKHAGRDNGRLPCTYDDFVRYGVRRKSIRPALESLEKRGLIRRVRKGHLVPGREGGAPSLFLLTFLPHNISGDWQVATGDWKRYLANAKK